MVWELGVGNCPWLPNRFLVTEWVMSGTRQGDLLGLPGTGRRFSVRGATVNELHEGKVRHSAKYWDLSTLLKQIGIIS